MIARQDYDSLVIPFEGKSLAKVFTGLRRVGKSGLLTLVRERLERKRENRGRVVAIDMEKDGNREYYQVAYRLLDTKTVEREFSVLEAVPDSFPKTVLTLDRIPVKRNGIHHCYLPDWLLGQVN